MKILKVVCCILLLLFGAGFFFIGAAGGWESLASGQPAGLVLMLPMTAVGVGAIWLGFRLLRGHPGKKAQEPVRSEQEKAARRKAEEDARRKENEAAAEKRRQEEQRWLEEHPALKAQFDSLQDMLQQHVLSFYDPSGEEAGGLDDDRNCTGGEWMRILPDCDLERAVAFYLALWDAKDRLTWKELNYASYEVRCTMRALCRREVYLRLNSERQLTTLGDRKDALLERCREQGIHLVLQPSRNEIVDLTYGRAYALRAGASGYNPLIDEVAHSEVNLVPVERTEGPQE